jgi:hypothetical protein
MMRLHPVVEWRNEMLWDFNIRGWVGTIGGAKQYPIEDSTIGRNTTQKRQ